MHAFKFSENERGMAESLALNPKAAFDLPESQHFRVIACLGF